MIMLRDLQLISIVQVNSCKTHLIYFYVKSQSRQMSDRIEHQALPSSLFVKLCFGIALIQPLWNFAVEFDTSNYYIYSSYIERSKRQH